MAYDYGLLSRNYGLLCGIVAHCFELPGSLGLQLTCRGFGVLGSGILGLRFGLWLDGLLPAAWMLVGLCKQA